MQTIGWLMVIVLQTTPSPPPVEGFPTLQACLTAANAVQAATVAAGADRWSRWPRILCTNPATGETYQAHP